MLRRQTNVYSVQEDFTKILSDKDLANVVLILCSLDKKAARVAMTAYVCFFESFSSILFLHLIMFKKSYVKS